MSESKNRGADALIQALSNAGVRRIFTLSGNHIMPIFDAAFDAGIELIHTRHEAAAVHMADAWARLTGEVGIAMVTGGPGHANAASALYTAQMAEAPVVLLSGHAPNSQLGMGAFQEMRQADLVDPVTKSSWTSKEAGSVAMDLAQAIRISKGGRPGPVHLSLPTDVLESEFPAHGQIPRRSDFEPEPMPLTTPDAQAVLKLLTSARQPLILVGPSCMARAGQERTAALEAASGIPVIGMESPRGVGDPSLGAFAEILSQADMVLLLGKRLDFTLKFGKSPAFNKDCMFVQIDPDATEIDRSRRAVKERLTFTCMSDPFAALDTLTVNAKEYFSTAGTWLEEVRSAVAYRPAAWAEAKSSEKGRLHPVQALRPLQALLDSHPDAVFVSDGGEIGQWAQACLSAPNRVINGVAGAIGAALPFALAASMAKPGAPVVAVMGDGTFGFHPAEFDTAVRYHLPFVSVVGNDARWNAEYQIQLRDYGKDRVIGCELLPSRYDRVAVAFGGYGELIEEPGEVLGAAKRAMQSGLPSCLNIMIEGLPAPNIKR